MLQCTSSGGCISRTNELCASCKRIFDVREAKCGVPRDIPVLLQSIREQFVEERKVEGHAAGKDDGGNGDNLGDNGAGQDALDKFNASVKQLLARQIVFRGWRILPYSMVVAAYIVLAMAARSRGSM